MLNDYLPSRYFCKPLLVLGVILNFCISAFSQQQTTVNGKVINNKGEALPGASVNVKGSNTTVLTNSNGDGHPKELKITHIFYAKSSRI